MGSDRPTLDNPLRIVFMGSPPWAVPSLSALLQSGEKIVAVVTQPDKPAGRGRSLASCAVARFAGDKGLPLLQPEKIQDGPEIERLNPDLIVVCAYGKILPRVLLDLPPQKCINVHFSLLPKYRGAAPVQWALINGDTETGATTLFMTEKVDAGPILRQRKIAIKADDDRETLGRRLSNVGADVLLETMELLKSGNLHPLPQNDREATPAPLLRKEDGWIDFGKKATTLVNQIRGMTPWPGAYTTLVGKAFKIYRAEILPRQHPGQPGEIVTAGPLGIEVACGQESLLLEEIQLEGKKRMPAAEFVKGHPLKTGTRFGTT